MKPVPPLGTPEYELWRAGALAEADARSIKSPELKELDGFIHAIDDGKWTDKLGMVQRVFFPHPTLREQLRARLRRR